MAVCISGKNVVVFPAMSDKGRGYFYRGEKRVNLCSVLASGDLDLICPSDRS